MMKKRWLLLAALACFSIGAMTACGEEEQEEQTGDYLEFTENFNGGLIASLKAGVNVPNVEIPAEHEGKTVEEIAGFTGNTSVKTVSLPNTILSLPRNAFQGCTSLTELVVPNSVQTIGWGIVRGCDSLQSLTVPFIGNTDYAYAGEDGTIRYFFGEDYGYIPDSLTSIAITNNKQIRTNAFEDCENLQSISLPANLTEVWRDAFEECTNLTAVHITDMDAWLDITFNSIYSNPLSQAKNLYLNGTLVEEVTANRANLKYATFYNCKSLKKLTLGEDLEEIQEYALEGCSNLVYNVKDGVNYLANPNTDYAWAISVADNTITSFTADPTTVGMNAYALDGCSGLKTVVISENVRFFGSNIFGNSPVEEATLGYAAWLGEGARNSLKKLTLTCETSLGSQYSDYAKLEEAYLPDTLQFTGQNIFAYCTALKSIVLPANLVSLGYNAFTGCTGLERIEIQNAEMLIDYNCPFWSCVNLKKLIVPTMDYDRFTLKKLLNPNCVVESLEIVGGTKIPDEACSGFVGLQSVTVPSTVTTIGEKAFNGCTSLTSFNITNGLRYVKKNAFAGCTNVTFLLESTNGQWKLVKNNSGIYYWDTPSAVKECLVTSSFVATYHWERYR